MNDAETFRHLANEFRWLVVAECAINDLRRTLAPRDCEMANRSCRPLTKPFGVSVVVHGRALLEFFRGHSKRFPHDPSSAAFGWLPSNDDQDMQ